MFKEFMNVYELFLCVCCYCKISSWVGVTIKHYTSITSSSLLAPLQIVLSKKKTNLFPRLLILVIIHNICLDLQLLQLHASIILAAD